MFMRLFGTIAAIREQPFWSMIAWGATYNIEGYL
jgi:hypothetical protein